MNKEEQKAHLTELQVFYDLQRVESKEVKEKAIQYTLEYNDRVWVTAIINLKERANVACLFVWHESPEGREYWREISAKLDKYNEEKEA
jgi:hypothetical protein